MFLLSKPSRLAGAIVLGALASVPRTARAGVNLGQVMALGDSITLGNTSVADTSSSTGYDNAYYAGGYRTEFYNRLHSAKVGFQFVGSKTDNTAYTGTTTTDFNNFNQTNPNFDNASATLIAAGQTANEGHYGYTIGRYLGDDGKTPAPDGGIYANLTAQTEYQDSQYAANHSGYTNFSTGMPYISASTNVQPQNFLILMGINNLFANYSEAETLDSLRQTLTVLTATEPNAHFYISTLLPISNAAQPTIKGLTDSIISGEITQFNKDLPGLIANYTTANPPFSMTLVDSYDLFAKAGLSDTISPDGIHPTADGYTILGDAFADAVLTNAAPEPTSALLLSSVASPLLLGRRRRRVA